jgi:anti-anti-sigma factor
MADDVVLGIDVTLGASHAVVAVRGELDLATAPLLDGVLAELIEYGCTGVVIEASGVRFLDCAGVRVIVAAANALTRHRGALVVRSPTGHVVRVLELSGVGAAVTIEQPASTVDASDPALGPALPQMAAIPASREMIETALGAVVVLAAAAIVAADGASLTLRRQGRLVTAASTGDTFVGLDQRQYETGEGPCVAAATQGQPSHVQSADDEWRWPAFMEGAIDVGVHSILSTPLLTATGPVGALNLYARRAGAFDAAGQDLAALFADQAATLISYGGLHQPAEQIAARLQAALDAREVIAQAQGVLMGERTVSAEAAHTILRERSQATSVPLIDQARQVIAAVADPDRD